MRFLPCTMRGMKKRKKARHDMLMQGELPLLWPDETGKLKLRESYRAPSNVSRLPPLQRSPRGEVVRASRLWRSQSLSSWLLSKSCRVVGFGTVRKSLFEMWLSQRLESCDFGALTLASVEKDACAELGLDLDEVKGLLLRSTREGGKFRSDGVIISRR
jgi:hypothetical protein